MSRIILCLVCAGFLAIGCDRAGTGKSPYNFVGFLGSLRYSDGKPVKNVRVKMVPFQTVDGYEGSPAEGVTDDKGDFTPRTDGIPKIYLGRYKIVIESIKNENEPDSPPEQPIPKRYQSVETTDRRIDVTKTGSRTVVILLERE